MVSIAINLMLLPLMLIAVSQIQPRQWCQPAYSKWQQCQLCSPVATILSLLGWVAGWALLPYTLASV